ncbi:response regulator [Stigmatella hybrida]|uniref:response regulator n=1 Tax=Stigmatella hybrida TaxID=394097 RepID=UPI001CDAAE86|nr:response regulator [Stigmatella hybrida]
MIKQCNVLLVDSEDSELGATGAMLSGQFQLRLANSGEAALGLLEKQSFDVLCTNLKLPRRNGLQLLRLAAGFHPQLACVLIADNREYWECCAPQERQGTFSLLFKPFTADELISTLWRAMAMVNLKRALANTQPGGLREKPRRPELVPAMPSDLVTP